MVTIDFGAIGAIDMRDMASVWERVFDDDFLDNFDGLYPAADLRDDTHHVQYYQLDTNDGIDGTGPGTGAAVWFFGHNFTYNGFGQPFGGTVNEVQVYNASDVDNGFETHRVLIYGLDIYFALQPIGSTIQPALSIVKSKDLDALIDGERLTILGHLYPDYLIGSNRADKLYGYSSRDTLDGRGGNDFLDGGVGVDRMLGRSGDDMFVWRGSDNKVDGGRDTDTLKLSIDLNLNALADGTLINVEKINMEGGGNDILSLARSEVLDLSLSDMLTVLGNAGDVVNAGSGWTHGADQTIAGVTYDTYTGGGATLLVDSDITQNIFA